MRTKHRFYENKINPSTEILVLGTFDPEKSKSPADSFYSGSKNFLWKLITAAFGEESLKGLEKEKKTEFLRRHKIDFVDLISEVEVENPDNYADHFIDSKVVLWRDVISEISKLPRLRKVCLTRKKLEDVPNMRKRVDEIAAYCKQNKISFEYLTTPARIYNEEKQAEWTAFFSDK